MFNAIFPTFVMSFTPPLESIVPKYEALVVSACHSQLDYVLEHVVVQMLSTPSKSYAPMQKAILVCCLGLARPGGALVSIDFVSV
jgi:hypothetical protein